MKKKYVISILIIICILIIDQILKKYILLNNNICILKNILYFTLVKNTGGAYGVGSQIGVTSIIISNIILLIIIAYMIIKRKELENKFLLINCSLVFAGGLSNLLDRIFRGYVVDYININRIIKYPVFNLADICIVIGISFIAIHLIKEMVKKNEEN